MTRILCVFAAFGLIACDDDDASTQTRDHHITVYGEDFVEDHIPAEETDGWRIEFSSLIVLVNDVRAGDAAIDGVHAIELTADSGGVGHAIGTLVGGPFTQLQYRIAPAASANPINLSMDAVQPLLDNGWSIRVTGEATRGEETITFDWGFDTDTLYSACETAPTETDDGVRSLLTIHADHFFYDDLVGDEPNVAFDLVASADADADGVVTLSEMAAVDITGLERYQVGSNGDITDLRAFIVAQTATLGHIDGEGHCDQAQ